MGRVIVMAFVSLDGITEDPDGSEKTPHGGWMFRYGPEAVAGDKFGLGEILDTGVLLLRRRTWMVTKTEINPLIRLITRRKASTPRNKIELQRLTNIAP